MGIDGIGKPGSGAPPGGIDPSEASAEAGPAATASGVSAESIAPSEALSRLERGELSLDAYLDLHITQATAHLEHSLSAEQLAFVKSSLREQLSTDPVLVELVRRATGGAPASR